MSPSGIMSWREWTVANEGEDAAYVWRYNGASVGTGKSYKFKSNDLGPKVLSLTVTNSDGMDYKNSYRKCIAGTCRRAVF